MTDFTIRPAQSSDLADWGDMRCALWPDSEPAELRGELERILDPDHSECAWIARDASGAAIGFVEANIRSYAEDCDGPTPYLEGIWVAEAWRRKGVAAALLAAVEDWARGAGYTEMASDALIDNLVSHDWHGAQGFAEVERMIVFRKAL